MLLALRGAVAPDGDVVYLSLALGVRAVNGVVYYTHT